MKQGEQKYDFNAAAFNSLWMTEGGGDDIT
jgi:hypothetical protein